MAHAVLRGGFLLHYYYFNFIIDCRKSVFHAHCYLISGFSLTHPMQVYVGRFSSSISCVLLCEEYLLYSQCCFMWDVSLTILSAMY